MLPGPDYRVRWLLRERIKPKEINVVLPDNVIKDLWVIQLISPDEAFLDRALATPYSRGLPFSAKPKQDDITCKAGAFFATSEENLFMRIVRDVLPEQKSTEVPTGCYSYWKGL